MGPSTIYWAVLSILHFSEGTTVQLPGHLNGHPVNKAESGDGATTAYAAAWDGQGGLCSNDPFLSSDPYEGKVFLFPWKESERKGDWYQNLGYCSKHCAEMVTINSDGENNYLHWFMRSNNMLNNPGAWLGTQIINATSPSRWMNREAVRYSNPSPGEYNEPGVTCLHIGWDGNNKWWNYYCSLNTMRIVCQRRNVRYNN